MYKPGKRNAGKNKGIAKRIDFCMKKLIDSFSPEKIILFGSFARGESGSGSTIDLLIIAETDLKFFERIKKAMIACSGGFPSIEPIVYTPTEFASLLEQGEGFLEEALEEGRVIYEKNKA